MYMKELIYKRQSIKADIQPAGQFLHEPIPPQTDARFRLSHSLDEDAADLRMHVSSHLAGPSINNAA